MKQTTNRRLRDAHRLLGVFFAPGIIFFAASGILQTLGLHEAGPDRRPVTELVGLLANVHKKDQLAPTKHRKPRETHAIRPATPVSSPPPAGTPLAPFAFYAMLLSFALVASTVSGLVMALRRPRAARETWATLAAGCIVPVLLLLT